MFGSSMEVKRRFRQAAGQSLAVLDSVFAEVLLQIQTQLTSGFWLFYLLLPWVFLNLVTFKEIRTLAT